MKIRPKLILAEIIVSLTLFLTILTSISSLVRFIGFENLKIETMKLQDTVSRMKYSVIDMLSSTEPTFYITYKYRSQNNQINQRLEEITEDPFFKRLSKNSRIMFTAIDDNLRTTQTNFNTKLITDYLNLRDKPDLDEFESLLYLQTVLRGSDSISPSFIGELDYAVSEISSQETVFSNFEKLIEQTLENMLQTPEDYSRRQMGLSISIPAIVFVLAVFGILLFTNNLSRKLASLDKSLSDIVGGDFSVRIDTKGKDEFSSLAGSINTFTKTLGAKLESFRLIMHEIGQTLTGSMESSQVETTLLKLAIRDTAADGAALYKVGGDAGELILSVSTGKFRPPFIVSDLPDSPEEEDINAILRSRIIQPGKTILGESAIQGRAIIIRDIENSNDIDWSRPETDALYLSSIIIVPLQIGSTVFGVIAITSTEPEGLFNDLEFANMQSFGELAAISLDNIYKYSDLLEATQLDRELGIAEEIQKDLLPKHLPRLSGGEVAILSRSIKGLNGDYYDVFPIGNGKTLVTICEVAGRGVPAGLVMVMIRTILRLVSTPENDARTVMEMLNRDMTRQIAIESYASVGILIIDSFGHYTFSSAAHYPLQILRSESGLFEAVQTEGIPVGIDRKASYKQQSGVLNKDDLVMFHTDGIPESRSREDKNFGIDNLLRIIGSKAGSSPEKIIETLKIELEYFERGVDQKDDQTVIVLKYTGGSAA